MAVTVFFKDDTEGMERRCRRLIAVAGTQVNGSKHDVRWLAVIELCAQRIEEEQRHQADAHGVREVEEWMVSDKQTFGSASSLQRPEGLPFDAVAGRKPDDAI